VVARNAAVYLWHDVENREPFFEAPDIFADFGDRTEGDYYPQQRLFRQGLELHPQARELILERMRDVAAEQGKPYEPEREDNMHRLNMGVFPVGAQIIPNPYNKIAGFSVRDVHFVPGFPVMAWPMIEWVLDQRYAHLHGASRSSERSVIVFGAMEAALTPLMEEIEARFDGVKVFSLPSVDHPDYGRHIELGVKGLGDIQPAYAALRAGLEKFGAKTGPELVR
jgi:molybdopterin-biosynthesis enzyme MoeA-like protein